MVPALYMFTIYNEMLSCVSDDLIFSLMVPHTFQATHIDNIVLTTRDILRFFFVPFHSHHETCCSFITFLVGNFSDVS
jgi:hypothetical protein